ncbi:MAG: diguanylate cyclase [Candidatus Thiodiazotropha sp. (ex Lucinoma borealis)]|nr:diguanylate cyclase [Candidatus Thiodiazotropha sp. (ex Lucinoma borealis)]MCU7865535.1 diguanylate cyclase [Candidatus Thiodiazotropha sp. (ex Lucinoma borealis)]
MTIFQKMLVTPFLSLSLYTGLILFGLMEYSDNNREIEGISEKYLTLLELSNENSRLFKQIVVQFKDAVLAGEQDWISSTHEFKVQINSNIDQLADVPKVLDPALTSQLRHDFNQYYTNALTLSLALLKNDREFSTQDKLIQSVEQYSNLTTSHLKHQKEQIKQRLTQAIERSNRKLNQLLAWGTGIAILLLLLMVTVTTLISLSTKRSFAQVIDRMMSLAEGRPDFSRRLEHPNKDELGYLIYWFNKLSETLERDYSKIQKISITDKLTQLSNRTHSDEYMRRQLAHSSENSSQIVVIIADIDHFKSINDRYGHLTGDQVLREFSMILKQCTRVQDFIGRWGGEEFIIVMPDVGIEQAIKNAERLRATIEQHNFGEAGQVTASFGISFGIEGDTQEDLMKRADQCLYKAKQQGRNQVVVDNRK